MAYKNKEDQLAKQRELYHRNPDKYKARNKLKREKRRKQILESLGGCCVECGSTTSLEIDHINPGLKTGRQSILSYGMPRAMSELDNLQLLCKECHKVKSDAQRKAAYKLFFSQPLEVQEKLLSEIKVTDGL